MEGMEEQMTRPDPCVKRGEERMVKNVGAEVRLNDERMSRWCIIFDHTIRRVEKNAGVSVGCVPCVERGGCTQDIWLVGRN